MSQLFLSNLTLSDFDGKFQLYLSDRALRFTDSGEQNMKIIPRDSVAAVTVRSLAADSCQRQHSKMSCACPSICKIMSSGSGDTDISFSTADIPKAIGCALISAAVSGWLEPWRHAKEALQLRVRQPVFVFS